MALPFDAHIILNKDPEPEQGLTLETPCLILRGSPDPFLWRPRSLPACPPARSLPPPAIGSMIVASPQGASTSSVAPPSSSPTPASPSSPTTGVAALSAPAGAPTSTTSALPHVVTVAGAHLALPRLFADAALVVRSRPPGASSLTEAGSTGTAQKRLAAVADCEIVERGDLDGADFYVPRTTVGDNAGDRMGWCMHCPEGGWYPTRGSDYRYHCRAHGLSARTKAVFALPTDVARSARLASQHVGTCGVCHGCVVVHDTKGGRATVEAAWAPWFTHASKCHDSRGKVGVKRDRAEDDEDGACAVQSRKRGRP